MDKKILVGSVFIALLMLASATFVVFTIPAKADDPDGPDYPQPRLKPDLVVWSMDIDSLLFGWYRLTYVIKNIGNLSAGPFYDEILWDGSPLVPDVYHSGLGVLQTNTTIINFQAQKGWHTITVNTDCDNDVDEWNEVNNWDNITWFYWWI